MNRGIKKYISIAAALIFAGISLMGCSKTAGTMKNGESKSKGRYIESKVDLPDEMKNMFAFQIEKSDGGYPVLYTCYQNEENGIYRYSMGENGDWDKSEISWLNGIDRKLMLMYNDKLMKGPDGEEYFYYRELDNEGHPLSVKLLKKCDDNSSKEIVLEDWKDLEPDSISSIDILKNGNIICNYDNSTISIYDKNTYKKICDIQEANLGGVTTYGDGYALFTAEETAGSVSDDELFTGKQTASSVSVYGEDGSKKDKVDFELKDKSCANMSLYGADDNSIIMCNCDGIHKFTQGTNVWETIVDGSLTSLSSPSLLNGHAISGKDNVYYVLLQDDTDSPHLMKYYYDETVASTPDVELNLYSLNNNNTVKEAVTVFQRNNPNVKVNFNVSMGEDSTGNKEDYIKSLNTELLSGKGADVILLDGLPVDSYIQKGGLADMSDIINPMIDSGELYSNVAEQYKMDGKIYSIPLRYGIPMISGNSEVVDASSDLKTLSEYAKAHKGEKIFGDISYSDLINQFLSAHFCDFYNDNREIDKDKLAEFLSEIKTLSDNCGAVTEYSDPEQEKSNFFDLASKAKIVMNDSMGIFDLMGDASAVKYVNGSMSSYRNEFIPSLEVGINASSSHIDIAKEFVKTLLSTEVQDKDMLDGFPMNTKSLQNWKDCTDYGLINIFQIENADGSLSDFNIGWPDQQRMDVIINAAQNASVKTKSDDVLSQIILDEGTEFLNGNSSENDAAERIADKAKIYLEE